MEENNEWKSAKDTHLPFQHNLFNMLKLSCVLRIAIDFPISKSVSMMLHLSMQRHVRCTGNRWSDKAEPIVCHAHPSTRRVGATSHFTHIPCVINTLMIRNWLATLDSSLNVSRLIWNYFKRSKSGLNIFVYSHYVMLQSIRQPLYSLLLYILKWNSKLPVIVLCVMKQA